MGPGQIAADGPATDDGGDLLVAAHAALDAELQAEGQDTGVGDPTATGGFSDTSSLLDSAIMGLQIAQRTARGVACRFPVVYRCALSPPLRLPSPQNPRGSSLYRLISAFRHPPAFPHALVIPGRPLRAPAPLGGHDMI